jgi:hypothetical protein
MWSNGAKTQGRGPTGHCFIFYMADRIPIQSCPVARFGVDLALRKQRVDPPQHFNGRSENLQDVAVHSLDVIRARITIKGP